VGIRFIGREEWLAGIKGVQTSSGDAGVWRAASFAKLVPSEIQGNAIHWPGGNGNFAKAQADPFGYVQGMQIDYRNRHGFDLGYNWVITPNGWVFEARGWFRSASQDEPGNNVDENGIAPSIQFACDLDGKITDLQVESARWMVKNTRIAFPLAKWIKGHREIGNNSTECPGDVLIARIHAGDFEPQEFDVIDPADITAIANQVRVSLGLPAGKSVQQATVDTLMAYPIQTPWAGAGETRPYVTAIFYTLRNSSAVYLGEALTGNTVTNPNGFWPALVNKNDTAQTQALANATKAVGDNAAAVKTALDTAKQEILTAIGNIPGGGNGGGATPDEVETIVDAALGRLGLVLAPKP